MDDLTTALLTLPPPFNVIVIVMLMIVGGSVLKSLIRAVRDYADHRAQERFKLELIQNGLSVDEAQRWTRLSVRKKNRRHDCRADSDSSAAGVEDYDSASVLT